MWRELRNGLRVCARPTKEKKKKERKKERKEGRLESVGRWLVARNKGKHEVK